MRVLMVALVVGLAACASAGERDARGNRNVLTLEEIAAAQEVTAYQLIQVHRPWWMRKRGPTSITRDNPINVYLDGTFFGGIEDLRGISTGEIREARFYSAAQATNRFGSGNVNGAIEILTRR